MGIWGGVFDAILIKIRPRRSGGHPIRSPSVEPEFTTGGFHKFTYDERKHPRDKKGRWAQKPFSQLSSTDDSKYSALVRLIPHEFAASDISVRRSQLKARAEERAQRAQTRREYKAYYPLSARFSKPPSRGHEAFDRGITPKWVHEEYLADLKQEAKDTGGVVREDAQGNYSVVPKWRIRQEREIKKDEEKARQQKKYEEEKARQKKKKDEEYPPAANVNNPRRVVSIADSIKKLKIRTTESKLNKALNFNLGGGYESKMSMVIPSTRGDSLTLKGDITSRGRKVGHFTRSLTRKREHDNALVVENDSFTILKTHQNKGIGLEFYRQSERAFKKMGFKYVSVYADIDIGKYAWARMGFDFANEAIRINVLNEFSRFVKERTGNVPKMNRSWSAWDVASYDDKKFRNRRGWSLGKQFFLGRGSDWSGIKPLDSKSKGQRVWNGYYRTKKKFKKGK